MTAIQVCHAIEAGIHKYSPDIDITLHPLADGGDGMLDILVENMGLDVIEMEVLDPLFRPIRAAYGMSPDKKTAYVEMSKASGLVLLSEAERNCLETTTYGTGQLIGDALKRGAKRIVLGMGGSATNDAGTGVAVALGYRLLDAHGKELQPVGKNLSLISEIDDQAVMPELANAEVVLASDVQNSFFGKEGAAWTFARQKGADDAAINFLDEGLQNFARVAEKKWNKDLQAIPGAGAAGGLGGGGIAFLNARLQSGIELLMEVTCLDDRISRADLVITGEGKLDEQTLSGKVIHGVVSSAKNYGKSVAALCGASELDPDRLKDFGVDYCGQIMKDGRSLQDAMQNGPEYLTQCAFDCISAMYASIHEESD